MKFTARPLIVLTSVAALAIGAAGTANARNGSDDPVREVHAGKRADDAAPHARRGADDRQADDRTRRATRRHGRGADDPAGHRRHGRGSDDPAGHR
ncbi:MAG: hypothetical protein QOJ12_2875 [Thermoleophilales bacterium]|jgi:Ni/Co efflux regulator RcnB|nr:hypothetical protein [Thermoleophilales bacterium]